MASVPVVLRQQVDRWAEAWIATTFSQLLEMRARDPGPFNYPIEVFPDWRGKAFYLCARFRARSRRPEDDFVVRHTRMTLAGLGRFDLAYFRHTDRWFTVYSGLTAADCRQSVALGRAQFSLSSVAVGHVVLVEHHLGHRVGRTIHPARIIDDDRRGSMLIADRFLLDDRSRPQADGHDGARPHIGASKKQVESGHQVVPLPSKSFPEAVPPSKPA